MHVLRFGGLILGGVLVTTAPALAQQAEMSHAAIAAAETNLSASVGFMHTHYSEGSLDSESGFTPGFRVGASGLLPSAWQNIDLYTALSYQFNAGNLDYNGHYLVSGAPVKATDNAVFNRIEAQMGLGLPFANGAAEAIPYFAAGYQAWNRNINQKDSIGTDEFYHAALVGGGIKLDVALTPTLVASGSGEILAMVGTHINSNSLGVGFDMGDSAQERFSLGLDDAITQQIHIQVSADVTHFNYAGSKPSAETFGLYEPLSTTTQVGFNIGVAYHF